MTADLRPLNGIAQVQAHNRCAWLRLLDTWGLRAVRAACDACGIPARLPDVEEALLARFAPRTGLEVPDTAPAAPAPTPPPAQEPPMAATPPDLTVNQADLLARLRSFASARGLTMRAACNACGTSTGLAWLLSRGKASGTQIARVRAWMDSPWPSMTTATKVDDQALAKAVTKAKATPRRLAAERSLPAADARRALVDVAAALGIQPITVYQVQGDRLVESQALPIGAA